MRINRAIGLGIGILVLGWLMPAVLTGLEATLLKFFHSAQKLFEASDAVLIRSGFST